MTQRKAVPGKQNFGLYVYRGKKKDTYYIRREAAGKTDLDQKLKSDNLNDARREANELVREWLGLKPKAKSQVLIDELAREWIKTKADKRPATQYSIKNSFEKHKVKNIMFFIVIYFYAFSFCLRLTLHGD